MINCHKNLQLTLKKVNVLFHPGLGNTLHCVFLSGSNVLAKAQTYIPEAAVAYDVLELVVFMNVWLGNTVFCDR
jgi:hypothetical protein